MTKEKFIKLMQPYIGRMMIDDLESNTEVLSTITESPLYLVGSTLMSMYHL